MSKKENKTIIKNNQKPATGNNRIDSNVNTYIQDRKGGVPTHNTGTKLSSIVEKKKK